MDLNTGEETGMKQVPAGFKIVFSTLVKIRSQILGIRHRLNMASPDMNVEFSLITC